MKDGCVMWQDEARACRAEASAGVKTVEALREPSVCSEVGDKGPETGGRRVQTGLPGVRQDRKAEPDSRS